MSSSWCGFNMTILAWTSAQASTRREEELVAVKRHHFLSQVVCTSQQKVNSFPIFNSAPASLYYGSASLCNSTSPFITIRSMVHIFMLLLNDYNFINDKYRIILEVFFLLLDSIDCLIDWPTSCFRSMSPPTPPAEFVMSRPDHSFHHFCRVGRYRDYPAQLGCKKTHLLRLRHSCSLRTLFYRKARGSVRLRRLTGTLTLLPKLTCLLVLEHRTIWRV